MGIKVRSTAFIVHSIILALTLAYILYFWAIESSSKNVTNSNQFIALKEEEKKLKEILPRYPVYVERSLTSEEKLRIKYLLNSTQNKRVLFQEFAKIAIGKSDDIEMENIFRAIEIVDVWYDFGDCVLSKFNDESSYRTARTKLETWTRETEGCCNDYAYALAGTLTKMNVKNNFVFMPGHIGNLVKIGDRDYYAGPMMQAIIEDTPENINADTRTFLLSYESLEVAEFRVAFLNRYFSPSKELLDLQNAGMLYKPNLSLDYCLTDERLHDIFYKGKYTGELYYLCNGILFDLLEP